MYALVLVLVLAVALYLAGRPLLQPDPEEEALLLGGPEAVRAKERERVFAALDEIANDYQTGKLSAVDYEQLKSEYTQKAVEFLKADAAGAAGSPRSTGERRNAARKQSGAAGGRRAAQDLEAEAEAEIALALATGVSSSAAAQFCPECGAQLLRADQKFCHVCGKTVGKGA